MNVTAEIRHNKIVLVAARASVYRIYPKVVPLLLNRLSWWSCLFQHSLGMSPVNHRHARARTRTHTDLHRAIYRLNQTCVQVLGLWQETVNPHWYTPTLKLQKYKYKSHIKSNCCPPKIIVFISFLCQIFFRQNAFFSIPVPKYSKYQHMHEHLFWIQEDNSILGEIIF